MASACINGPQALKGAQGADKDWYFCRGYFLQASNSFRPYTQDELGASTHPLAYVLDVGPIVSSVGIHSLEGEDRYRC